MQGWANGALCFYGSKGVQGCSSFIYIIYVLGLSVLPSPWPFLPRQFVSASCDRAVELFFDKYISCINAFISPRQGGKESTGSSEDEREGEKVAM